MKEIIDNIRKEYELQLQRNATEEDIKFHIIQYIFLKEMGFDLHECRFEENAFSGRQDIVTGEGKDVLTIETKKPTPKSKIEYKDIEQVHRYLKNKGREWGLVTNGRQYVLVNATIQTNSSDDGKALLDDVVFDFDICKSKGKDITNHKFFKYLSKERLFNTKTTQFFRYVQQYRVWSDVNAIKSWKDYVSTLYAFYDFLDEKGRIFNNGTTLELISIQDFNDFIDFKTKSNSLSKSTINNNWSHISSMMKVLKKNRTISYSAFDAPREPQYNGAKEEVIKNINYVTSANVKKIISFYKSRNDSSRNIAAFLLCLLYGFEKSDINELKWSQIRVKEKEIIIGNRVIKYNPMLESCLEEMSVTKKRGKNKLEYVFCTKHNGNYNKFKETTLNDIFDRIAEVGEEDFWKQFSPKYVKNCSIKVYFDAGYSLDEIIYLTGMEIKNIEPSYITTEEVLMRVKKGVVRKSDVLEGIFNIELGQWDS